MAKKSKASHVIDATTRMQVLETFISKLREHYVFSEVAEQKAI